MRAALLVTLMTACGGPPTVPEPDAAVSSADLVARVKFAFYQERLTDYEMIEVINDNGRITLRGGVDSQATIDQALEIASGVENVESVLSELTVRTP